MPTKTFYRLLVDIAMLLLTTLLMAYTLAENQLHEFFGVTFFALYFLHQVLNIKWFRGLLTGKYTLRRIVNTIVDVLLSVAMLALMVSGIMISQSVMPFLNFGSVSVGRTIHTLASHWYLLLMAIHLGLYLEIILAVVNKVTDMSVKEKYVYICGKYHHHKEDCTPHTIKALNLRQIVLMEIQRVTQEANLHREAFLRRAMEKHEAQLRKDMLSQERELNKARKRLAELDTLFRTTFEQLALKHISDEQFQMLSGGYGQEKQELTDRIGLLEDTIASDRDKMLNADRFLKIVDKYIAIQELTPEIVREFIDKVVVHDRSEPWKKKNYTQQVDVYFNFVGKV